MTEHRHRKQLPLWGVFVIVIVFLTLFFSGVTLLDDWQGIVLGIVLAFGFLSVAGAIWAYDSTDGRNWRGPIR